MAVVEVGQVDGVGAVPPGLVFAGLALTLGAVVLMWLPAANALFRRLRPRWSVDGEETARAGDRTADINIRQVTRPDRIRRWSRESPSRQACAGLGVAARATG